MNGNDVFHLTNVIGTVTLGSNGTDLLISLTSSATPGTVSELLQTIQYHNTSNAPGNLKQIGK